MGDHYSGGRAATSQETVETVSSAQSPAITPLKQGVNERRSTLAEQEISRNMGSGQSI
jgi:hypothetical protein